MMARIRCWVDRFFTIIRVKITAACWHPYQVGKLLWPKDFTKTILFFKMFSTTKLGELGQVDEKIPPQMEVAP